MDHGNNPIRARLKSRGLCLADLAAATGRTLATVAAAVRRAEVPASFRVDLRTACDWTDAELSAACNEIRAAARAKMGLSPARAAHDETEEVADALGYTSADWDAMNKSVEEAMGLHSAPTAEQAAEDRRAWIEENRDSLAEVRDAKGADLEPNETAAFSIGWDAALDAVAAVEVGS